MAIFGTKLKPRRRAYVKSQFRARMVPQRRTQKRAGQSDVSIEHLKAFMRFSPRARVGWALYTIGASHFLAKRFDEALPKLLLAVQDDPTNQGAYRFLAACYAHMGRLEEARQTVQRLRVPLVPRIMPWRDPDHRELLLSGLRLAAGEAT